MRCPNCHAECSDQANQCDFCGQALVVDDASVTPPALPASDAVMPPEIPDFSPPPIPARFESDNPYAVSEGSSHGHATFLPSNEVPNHLGLSITATILTLCCCCIPFGIVPLIFSTQVNSKLAIGDYEGARSASDNAKLWSWISIGIALCLFVFNMMARIVMGFQ